MSRLGVLIVVAMAGTWLPSCEQSPNRDSPDVQDASVETPDDRDGDGIHDDLDNCPDTANARQIDTDGDGVGNACDPATDYAVCAGRGGDDDGDDVCQTTDNCPGVSNADQQDQDNDGLGDVCDPKPLPCDDLGGDADSDTVCDAVDNCPDEPNLNQLDTDSDNIGDVCDPSVPQTLVCSGLGGDLDDDDWCGLYDNCPNDANPTQSDLDQDGIGDACDVETCDGVDNDGDGQPDNGFLDVDGDGVADCIDPCPLDAFSDADQDGIEDCVDPCLQDPDNDSDGDGICLPADNCPTLAFQSLNDRDGDGIGDACDVEECDGIGNDFDTRIDEGLPDADADGVCDDIDPCDQDPDDDADGDGVCGDVDNCPAQSNATQADDDGDGWGNACDIDSPDSCDASALESLPGVVAIPSTLRFERIVPDPVRDVIYGSVGTGHGIYSNSIVAVHAPTRSILWSTFVGSDPDALAISADSTTLYVGLFGAASVRMVNVPFRRACLSFPLPTASSFSGPLRAREMGVLPDFPETVVVSTRRLGVSPDFGGVFVFDNGLRRPVSTPSHTGAREIVIASNDTVYGYNNSSTEFGFRKLTVSSSGVVNDWVVRDLFSGFGVDMFFAGGRVFSSNGAVVNPTVPSLLGTTNGLGAVTADVSLSEVYYATSASSISVYDTDTFDLKGSIAVSGLSSTPIQLISWGDDGLALLASGVLVVLDGARGLP